MYSVIVDLRITPAPKNSTEGSAARVVQQIIYQVLTNGFIGKYQVIDFDFWRTTTNEISKKIDIVQVLSYGDVIPTISTFSTPTPATSEVKLFYRNYRKSNVIPNHILSHIL